MKKHNNPLLSQSVAKAVRTTKVATNSGAFVDLPLDSHGDVFTANHAAQYIGYSPKTLANWRVRGIGPGWVQYCKGGKVLYQKSQLDTWLAAHGRRSTIQL